MKTSKLYKKINVGFYFPISLLFIFVSCSQSFAQTNTVEIDPLVKKHLNDLVTGYNDHGSKSRLLPAYVLNDSLKQFHYKVSGTAIKNGQIQSISTVLDDKSLTLNYTLPFEQLRGITIQPTVTGTGTKSLIELFNGDKYAKTITWGGNISVFLRGSFFYKGGISKDNFKWGVKAADEHPAFSAGLATYRVEKANAVDALVAFKANPIHADLFSGAKLDASNYAQYYAYEQDLQKLLAKAKEFFPEKFDTRDYKKVGVFIDDLGKNKASLVQYVSDVKRLNTLDSVQTHAPVTSYRFHWLTLSAKQNSKSYPIYDAGNVAKHYTRTERDNYMSVTARYNYMRSYTLGTRVLLSPGLTFANARDFDSDDSLSVHIFKELVPGIDSIQSVTSTGFYKTVADRKSVVSLDIPLMFAWKKGVGIDLGVGYKFKSNANAFDSHFGVFFSVPTAAGSTVVLEPIVKFVDDQSKTYKRDIEKFSVGFSLSFAVPAFAK